MDINDGRQTTVRNVTKSRSPANLQASQRKAIRAVFLERKDSYVLPEVARLTGVTAAELRRRVRAGDRDAEKIGRAWRFTWRQLTNFALEVWTLAEIHAALGSDAATVLPPLLSLRSVTVCLPEYIVRALEMVAREDRTTIDATLHVELVDFAGVWSKRMEPIAPGYRRAMLFPAQD